MQHLPPLHAYMYDLPLRFNLVMLDRRMLDRNDPLDLVDFPPWPPNSGLKRQHSVEYWMMAERIGNAKAVRVRNGDDAEVFFVPFFSSLSFNTHGHNMTYPETEIDRQLQETQEEEDDGGRRTVTMRRRIWPLTGATTSPPCPSP